MSCNFDGKQGCMKSRQRQTTYLALMEIKNIEPSQFPRCRTQLSLTAITTESPPRIEEIDINDFVIRQSSHPLRATRQKLGAR
jgi:hypothetical protein